MQQVYEIGALIICAPKKYGTLGLSCVIFVILVAGNPERKEDLKQH
jgi:hypothetical protein